MNAFEIFKRNRWKIIPSFVLVSFLGVDVAFCLKNNINLQELKASAKKDKDNDKDKNSNDSTKTSALTGFMMKYERGMSTVLLYSGSGSLGLSAELGKLCVSGGIQISGSIHNSLVSAYKMDCYSAMGCYTSCSPMDWTLGEAPSVLEQKGCN